MAIAGVLTSPSGREYDVEFDSEPTPEQLNAVIEDITRAEADTGQGVLSSMGGAAVRGATAIGTGAMKGMGAIIPGGVGDIIRDEASGIEGDIENAAPVNPALEKTFPVKSAGALGQGVSFLGLGLLSGGSSLPVLGVAGLGGAGSGAEVADEMGVDGWRRALLTGGFAAAEAGVESIGGIGSKGFLSGSGGFAKEFGKAIIQEAAEEPITGFAQDLTKNLASLGTDTPFENPFDLGKRGEELLYGGIGAIPFGIVAGVQGQRAKKAKRFAVIEGAERDVTDLSEKDLTALGIDISTVRTEVELEPTEQAAVNTAAAMGPGVNENVSAVLGMAAAADFTPASAQELDALDDTTDVVDPIDDGIIDETDEDGNPLDDWEDLNVDAPVIDEGEEEDIFGPGDSSPASETTDPTTEGSAPGGVSDLESVPPRTGTGSSAPAVSYTEQSPNTENVNKNIPTWVQEAQQDALEQLSVKQQIRLADLAAERKTADEIAKELGVDKEIVIGARGALGIPSWTTATSKGGAPVENPEFTRWVENYTAGENKAQDNTNPYEAELEELGMAFDELDPTDPTYKEQSESLSARYDEAKVKSNEWIQNRKSFQSKIPPDQGDPSPESLNVKGDRPENPMPPDAIIERISSFHGLDQNNVALADMPEVKAYGWWDPSSKRVVINLPWIRNQDGLDETIYHEFIHRIEREVSFRKDINAVVNSIPKELLGQLDERLLKAGYNFGELPTERAAVILSDAAVQFRKLPAWQRLIASIKAWFNKTFGRALSEIDAAAIASRIVARALNHARRGAAVRGDAGNGNVRRSLPLDERRAKDQAQLASAREHAKKLTAMSEDERGDVEFSENYLGFQLYEMEKIKPKEGKIKRLTSSNNDTLSSDAHALITVDGEVYLLTREEDPDDEDLEIWSFGNLNFPETWYKFIETAVDTKTGDVEDLISEIRDWRSKNADVQFSRPLEPEPTPASSTPAPAGPPSGATGPTAQVFGVAGTAPVTPAGRARTMPIIKASFFDGDAAISTTNTDKAYALSRDFLDPTRGVLLAQKIETAVDPLDKNIAVGFVHAELMKYGHRLAASGDTSLYTFLLDKLTDKFIATSSGQTYRDIGQLLYGRSHFSLSPSMAAEKISRDDMKEAEAQNIPAETVDDISKAVDNTALPEAEISAIGQTVLPSGETVEGKIDKIRLPRKAKVYTAAELRAQEAAAEKRRAENKKIRAAARAARKMIRRIKSEAERALDKLAAAQSDTMEPARKKPTKSDFRKMYDTAVKSTFSEAVLRKWLAKKMSDMGIDPKFADPLVPTIIKERDNRRVIAEAKKAQALADGTKGSLKGLEKALAEAPGWLQQKPSWRRRLMLDYFKQLGLSDDAAKTATRFYDAEFSKRLQQALENAIKKAVAKSPPWADKVRKVNNPLIEKMNKNLATVIKNVRLGITDPRVSWHEELATANGWKGFTIAQHERMVAIDNELSQIGLPDFKRAKLLTELDQIISDAKRPPTTASLLLAHYVASALSGISTLTVQFSSHVGAARSFVTNLIADPLAAPVHVKGFLDATKTLYRETKFAAKNDVYRNDVGEHMKGHERPLQKQLELGLKNWRSENPKLKAKGMFQMLIGAQSYTMRTLSSLDQGFISGSREYNTLLFTDRMLRKLGLTREQSRQLIEEALRAKADAQYSALESGMNDTDAGAFATDVMLRKMYDALASQDGTYHGMTGEQLADDVALGALRDAEGSVGRQSPGVEFGDEGSLSRIILAPLKGISEGMSKAGYTATGIRATYGFVLIPFRTAKWYAGYSPWGYVRWSLHRGAIALGKESPYKQSYATASQERQRLIDATAGSALMVLAAALAQATADDDPGKSEAFKVMITGYGPDDKSTRDAWLKQYKPYSVIVKVGRSYVPLNLGRIGESVGWPLAMAGAFDDQALKTKAAGARGKVFPGFEAFMGAYLGSLTQRSSFQGITKLAELQKGYGSGNVPLDATNLVTFGSSALIPWKGAMTSVQRLITNPQDRTTYTGAILSNIPVVGPLTGRPAINTLGDPVNDQSLSGRAFSVGIPLPLRVDTTGDSYKAYDVILDQGRGPSTLRRNDIEKIYGAVTDDVYYKFVSIRGKAIKQSMIKDYEKLKALDSEKYASYLEKLSRRVNPEVAKSLGLKVQK